MTLRVYNTLTKQKDLFEPVTPGKVGMYLCGPTVYKPPHIGHMVGPVIFDAIKRYLQFKGYEVTWVVNITDVEDKLIIEAAKTGMPVSQLAEKFTKDYLDCLGLLGVNSIDCFPKASEHIPEIIALCEQLVANGHAYASEGNVWFDVTTDPDYGKLSHRRVEEQESGMREIEKTGARNAADFALWKAAKPTETTEPSWDSPWGKGRPGWHIECSAMSMKYLGKTLDIHGGGMDLLFPHHENELAQSESATGTTFVKYWLHNGLTKIKTKAASGEWKEEKMSKSLGNVVDAREAIARFGPGLLRYMLLSTHYRRPIEFTDEVMTATRKGLSVFHRLFQRIERLAGEPLDEKSPALEGLAAALLEGPHSAFTRAILALKMKFLEMMDDDFNTAGAIAVLHEMAGEVNGFVEKSDLEKTKQPEAVGGAAAAAQTLRQLGRVLGLFTTMPAPQTDASDALLEQLMHLLIQLRQHARQTKNFALADAIRNGLTEIGITLEDRADATGWRRD